MHVQMVKEAGGLNIADEVQSGFGRCGSHYWGFETQVGPFVYFFPCKDTGGRAV